MSTFNSFGKPAETVDFGGEVDYASYEWFKDPPARPEVITFLTLPCVLLTHICSLPPRPLRANPTSRLPLSSTGTTCVTLLSRRRRMYCSGATNSTDRCIYPSLHPAFFRANDFFPSTPAGRTRMVRRVQRDDRRAQAARDFRRHVRLYEGGGAESLRGDPATAARY